MIASRGNVADTGITDRVNDIINDRFWSDGKKPDRCDVLQELIDCGDISAKDAKSTQKAWNCRHSRQSNDKKDSPCGGSCNVKYIPEKKGK